MFYAKWVHQPGDSTVRSFTWRFHTGLSGAATCQVNVYIPNGSSTTVGANPAPYSVDSGSSDSQSVGSFSLDQVDNQGQWLSGGTFPSTGGQLSVSVANLGGGSVEVAADVVKVRCGI
jgi:translation initiation factor IF-2